MLFFSPDKKFVSTIWNVVSFIEVKLLGSWRCIAQNAATITETCGLIRIIFIIMMCVLSKDWIVLFCADTLSSNLVA